MWLLGRRHRFRIDGDSMIPTLDHRDFVLADMGYYRKHKPEIGDVVVLKHPYNGLIIVKRVHLVAADGFMVTGDNASASSDSRSFGMLSHEAILGRVTSRI